VNKKQVLGLSLLVSLASLVSMAGIAGATYLDIDSDFLASSTAYVGELFTDMKILVAMVIGFPLGFWVIRRAIGLVRAR